MAENLQSSKRHISRSLALITFLVAVTSLPAGASPTADSKQPSVPLPSVIYCSSTETDVEGEFLAPMQILQNKKVQDNLGLSPLQIEKLKELVSKTEEVFMTDYIKKGVRSDSIDNLRREIDESRRRVSEIFRQEQLARLRGIMVQLYGLWSLMNKDLQETLRLTPEQKDKYDAVRVQMFEKINELSDKPIPLRSGFICKFTSIESTALKDIVGKSEQSFFDLLTAEQREALKGMQGASFSLDK